MPIKIETLGNGAAATDEQKKQLVKDYLSEVDSLFPQQPKQWRHKFAVGRYWLDMFGIDDAETRFAAMKQFIDGTPAAFGCNDSALAQTLGTRVAAVKSIADFLGKA